MSKLSPKDAHQSVTLSSNDSPEQSKIRQDAIDSLRPLETDQKLQLLSASTSLYTPELSQWLRGKADTLVLYLNEGPWEQGDVAQLYEDSHAVISGELDKARNNNTRPLIVVGITHEQVNKQAFTSADGKVDVQKHEDVLANKDLSVYLAASVVIEAAKDLGAQDIGFEVTPKLMKEHLAVLDNDSIYPDISNERLIVEREHFVSKGDTNLKGVDTKLPDLLVKLRDKKATVDDVYHNRDKAMVDNMVRAAGLTDPDNNKPAILVVAVQHLQGVMQEASKRPDVEAVGINVSHRVMLHSDASQSNSVDRAARQKERYAGLGGEVQGDVSVVRFSGTVRGVQAAEKIIENGVENGRARVEDAAAKQAEDEQQKPSQESWKERVSKGDNAQGKSDEPSVKGENDTRSTLDKSLSWIAQMAAKGGGKVIGNDKDGKNRDNPPGKDGPDDKTR